jgi:GGDEF domain-containing protein
VSPREDPEPLRRAIDLLVRGIEVHTVAFEQEDYTSFRTALASAQRQLDCGTDDLLTVVGGAIQALGEYNRRTSDHIRIRLSEMQGMVSTLIGALEHMVSFGDTSANNLKGIQARLATAAKTEDLRALKSHLSDCLRQITEEVEAHKNASKSGKAILATSTKAFEPKGNESDPLTGLPGRVAAEAALNEAARTLAQTKQPGAAAIFVLPRLVQINLRFGRSAGDHLLEQLSIYLGSGIHPDDSLFRWTGPALLALIRRDVPLEDLRAEIRTLLSTAPEQEVRVGDHIATVPLSVAWAAFPISPPLDRLINRIEVFAANRTGEGAAD